MEDETVCRISFRISVTRSNDSFPKNGETFFGWNEMGI